MFKVFYRLYKILFLKHSHTPTKSFTAAQPHLERGNLMSVRKITNKGGVKKNIGKFPSLKVGKNVWWESLLERDYIHLLEFDPDVERYEEQPMRVPYPFEGKIRYYTPDFLVERIDGRRIVVEVKSKKKASDDAFRLFFLAVAPVIHKRGYEFIVVTDEMIRVEPLLENIKILWGYSRVTFYSRHQVLCRKFLRENDGASIADLARALSDKGVTLPVIYSLVYRGALSVDLNCPLDPSSIVRPAALVSRQPAPGGEAVQA
jgi:TnsA endonuclease N terminal